MSTELQKPFDHSSDPRFLEYYSRASQSKGTAERFGRIMDRALALMAGTHAAGQTYDVVDVGCGAGAQAMMWAQAGHRVRAIDINEPLIAIAQERAVQQELQIQFVVGSATQLPFAAGSADVVLLPELLEHVADWECSLVEAIRVLRPRGLLYVSTSNRLCPWQQEFNLPAYSWYPRAIKRWCEVKAVTTHPEWANHTRYPAVNWFSYFELRDWFEAKGLSTLDRFDVLNRRQIPVAKKAIVGLVVRLAPLRFLGHVLTEGTSVWATRKH